MRKISYLLNSLSLVISSFLEKPIIQIIAFGFVCISSFLSIWITFCDWFKKSIADGKITKEELDELNEKIKDEINKKGSNTNGDK